MSELKKRQKLALDQRHKTYCEASQNHARIGGVIAKMASKLFSDYEKFYKRWGRE